VAAKTGSGESAALKAYFSEPSRLSPWLSPNQEKCGAGALAGGRTAEAAVPHKNFSGQHLDNTDVRRAPT
jgi:hypothetical protein